MERPLDRCCQRRQLGVGGPAHGVDLLHPEQLDPWIERYVTKYPGEVSADFLRQNLMWEFVAERAFAIVD